MIQEFYPKTTQHEGIRLCYRHFHVLTELVNLSNNVRDRYVLKT